MADNKNLLIINHDFPPAGGAGIKRCLKFIKFLPDFGWNITVLTVRDGNHPIIDSSLEKEVKINVKIYRSTTYESFFYFLSKPKTVSHTSSIKRSPPKKTLFTTRILKYLYNTFGEYFKIPDSRILWIIPAYHLAKTINKKHNFDLIFATGPTFVNFIIAAMLKRKLKKRLVIDFRDAWVADPMLKKQTKKYLYKIHSRLEKFVINRADKVISTNPFVARDFQERYKDKNNTKFFTIYNGYDKDDFTSLTANNNCNNNYFSIVYTGRLYDERTPKHFLKALSLAIRELPEMESRVRATFVGSCEKFLDGKCIEDYITQYNLKKVTNLTGHISRKESLEYQVQASLLLMIIGIVPPEMELTYGLSGKVFDYILCKKPILTLANGGATREFIVNNKIGKIFFHKDIEEIKTFLMEAYMNFKSKKGIGMNSDVSEYEKYDFRSLTKNLSLHFESAIYTSKGN